MLTAYIRHRATASSVWPSQRRKISKAAAATLAWEIRRCGSTFAFKEEFGCGNPDDRRITAQYLALRRTTAEYFYRKGGGHLHLKVVFWFQKGDRKEIRTLKYQMKGKASSFPNSPFILRTSPRSPPPTTPRTRHILYLPSSLSYPIE
jgi:hypothetical protein